MLITVSKCISTISSQVILKDVHYHKYHPSASSLANFMQERDCGYTPAQSIFCVSRIWVEADIPLCKIVLHAPGPGCSMALLWSFHPAAVSLLPPEKLSDNNPLGEACRQIKKNGLESQLLMQIAVLFKFNTFFSTILESSNCIPIRISNS